MDKSSFDIKKQIVLINEQSKAILKSTELNPFYNCFLNKLKNKKKHEIISKITHRLSK